MFRVKQERICKNPDFLGKIWSLQERSGFSRNEDSQTFIQLSGQNCVGRFGPPKTYFLVMIVIRKSEKKAVQFVPFN